MSTQQLTIRGAGFGILIINRCTLLIFRYMATTESQFTVCITSAS